MNSGTNYVEILTGRGNDNCEQKPPRSRRNALVSGIYQNAWEVHKYLEQLRVMTWERWEEKASTRREIGLASNERRNTPSKIALLSANVKFPPKELSSNHPPLLSLSGVPFIPLDLEVYFLS